MSHPSKALQWAGAAGQVLVAEWAWRHFELGVLLPLDNLKASRDALQVRVQAQGGVGHSTHAPQTIETIGYLQTLYPDIHAVGEVAGPFQFTHTAAHQAWHAAVIALFGRIRKLRADHRMIPRAAFTDPEVARVGLSEREAKERGVACEMTKYGLGLNKILVNFLNYPTLAEASKYEASEWKRAHAPKKLLHWVSRHHAWERA